MRGSKKINNKAEETKTEQRERKRRGKDNIARKERTKEWA